MKLNQRLEALRAKKAIIEAKIMQECARPQPDMLRLQALKRQRLTLKDKMASFARRMRGSLQGPQTA